MFEVTVEINDEYQMYKNGMAEGIPVLIKNVGGYFDNEPFSAESMFKLALEAAQDVESKDLVVSLWNPTPYFYLQEPGKISICIY